MATLGCPGRLRLATYLPQSAPSSPRLHIPSPTLSGHPSPEKRKQIAQRCWSVDMASMIPCVHTMCILYKYILCMYIYIYIYVCIYIYTYICECVCVYICIYIHMYVYVYTYIYICICVCVWLYKFVYVYIYILCMYIYI